ncbi:MAG: DUF4058 family protein [Planctomycetaceae bacterium]
MPSPFPGMDPFIESQGFWPDFHATFINYVRERLADQLPDSYDARLDERVNFVRVQDDSIQRIRPDVSISQSDARDTGAATSGGVATLEPVTLQETIEEEVREAYIEIINREDRSLVTILEVLSPTNKNEPARGHYLTKRLAILQQPVHLVELDLLRGGRRHNFARPLPPGDYYAYVSRVEKRMGCDVYAWPLERCLPTIPVPLAKPDPDVLLDLQAVFSLTYDRGRYQRAIDYGQPLTPTLDEQSRQWAESLLHNG